MEKTISSQELQEIKLLFDAGEFDNSSQEDFGPTPIGTAASNGPDNILEEESNIEKTTEQMSQLSVNDSGACSQFDENTVDDDKKKAKVEKDDHEMMRDEGAECSSDVQSPCVYTQTDFETRVPIRTYLENFKDGVLEAIDEKMLKHREWVQRQNASLLDRFDQIERSLDELKKGKSQALSMPRSSSASLTSTTSLGTKRQASGFDRSSSSKKSRYF